MKNFVLKLSIFILIFFIGNFATPVNGSWCNQTLCEQNGPCWTCGVNTDMCEEFPGCNDGGGLTQCPAGTEPNFSNPIPVCGSQTAEWQRIVGCCEYIGDEDFCRPYKRSLEEGTCTPIDSTAPSCSLTFSPSSPQSVATSVAIYPNASDNVAVRTVRTYVNRDPNGGTGGVWDLIGESNTGNFSWTTSNTSTSHTSGTHVVAANVWDTANVSEVADVQGHFHQCTASYTLATPVNGVCAATHYSCGVGASANNVSGSTTWTWNCNGSNGGTNASCSENKPVNGTCAATHYSCTSGTSLNWIDATYVWAWACNGSNGGTNASCSENKPVNGVCAATHYNCGAGTSANNDGSDVTVWTWTCNGANGGTTPLCYENKPTTPIGTCGTFNTVNATTPITWTWANGTGLQVWDSTGAWWYNSSATPGITIAGIPPGRTVYARTTYNYTDFSSLGSVTCPLPDNTFAVISGDLRQKSGTGCYQADASNNFNVSSLTASTGGDSCVTALCEALPLPGTSATSYSCTVTWNNQACVAQGRQPALSQTLTISAISIGYSSGQFSNSSCALNGTSLSVTSGVNNLDADLSFPFTGNNLIKIKSGSYQGKSVTGIAIPAFISSYDADDDASKYFIIGSSGSVINTTVVPGSAYSTPGNWHDSSYTGSFPMNPSGFLSYVKSRKTHKTISSLDEIDSNGIYIYSGATLDINSLPSKFNQFNIVLIVQGVININTNLNDPGLKSIALIATNTINFASSVAQVNGIFISQTVDTGSNSNQGLKIKGNLIAQTTLTQDRAWSDTSKPSIFVVFDQIPYINLLPYLSTASYDWKQTQ